MVPERKGRFKTPAEIKAFLIELFDCRPAALVSVVTIYPDGPHFDDGPEYLEIMDGRQRYRAARHRESTAAAWRSSERETYDSTMEREHGPDLNRDR